MLRAIEAIVAHNDPKPVKELIQKIDRRRVVEGTRLPVVEADEASAAPGERRQTEEIQAKSGPASAVFGWK